MTSLSSFDLPPSLLKPTLRSQTTSLKRERGKKLISLCGIHASLIIQLDTLRNSFSFFRHLRNDESRERLLPCFSFPLPLVSQSPYAVGPCGVKKSLAIKGTCGSGSTVSPFPFHSRVSFSLRTALSDAFVFAFFRFVITVTRFGPRGPICAFKNSISSERRSSSAASGHGKALMFHLDF